VQVQAFPLRLVLACVQGEQNDRQRQHGGNDDDAAECDRNTTGLAIEVAKHGGADEAGTGRGSGEGTQRALTQGEAERQAAQQKDCAIHADEGHRQNDQQHDVLHQFGAIRADRADEK
jgi:hypothetical protein